MNDVIGMFASRKKDLYKVDGEDHIRISPYGKTDLGKILSQGWRKPFYIPRIGNFLTPECFAKWITTGDEDARHNVRFRFSGRIRNYRELLLFAKYYQLCALSDALGRFIEPYRITEGDSSKLVIKVPLIGYTIHDTGLREYDRWPEYPGELMPFIESILDPMKGPTIKYQWPASIVKIVDDGIAAIVGASKEAEELQQSK